VVGKAETGMVVKISRVDVFKDCSEIDVEGR